LFSRIQVGDMKLEHFIEIFIVCFSPFTACTFSVSWDAYIWKLSFHYWTRLSSSFPVFFTIISKYNLCLWMQFLHSKSVFFLLFTFSLIVVYVPNIVVPLIGSWKFVLNTPIIITLFFILFALLITRIHMF
jgi:hypothetical protein